MDVMFDWNNIFRMRIFMIKTKFGWNNFRVLHIQWGTSELNALFLRVIKQNKHIYSIRFIIQHTSCCIVEFYNWYSHISKRTQHFSPRNVHALENCLAPHDNSSGTLFFYTFSFKKVYTNVCRVVARRWGGFRENLPLFFKGNITYVMIRAS